MMQTKYEVSVALQEVWEWKEKVYQELKEKGFEEKKQYYRAGLDEAVKLLGAKLIENPDGSYHIV